MTRSSESSVLSRFVTAACLPLVLGAGLLTATTATATAAPDQGARAAEVADAPKRRTLAGRWNGSVQTTIPSQGTTTLTFLSDGTLDAPDTGVWQQHPNATFTFSLRYTNVDAEGQVVGYTEGRQHGQVSASGDQFSSTGTSYVYDLEGTVLRSFDLSISAVHA